MLCVFEEACVFFRQFFIKNCGAKKDDQWVLLDTVNDVRINLIEEVTQSPRPSGAILLLVCEELLRHAMSRLRVLDLAAEDVLFRVLVHHEGLI